MRGAFGSMLVALLAVTSVAPPARANGRFPRAQRLLERGGDPDELVLSATYGLLFSDDRGGEWRHMCELGFAFAYDDIDPLIELPADGALLVRTSHSVNRSEPPFCDYVPVLGGGRTDSVVDLTLDRADRSHVLALMVQRGDAGSVNQLYASHDSGKTFEVQGAPLPADLLTLGITLDVAPSDANRYYVSGLGLEDPSVFARSDDAGAHWTVTSLPLPAGETPYIAAVSPTDPDVVYLRTNLWQTNAESVVEANDGLLFSDDGGASFHEIFRAKAKLLGFALSPDESEVLLGYGDPVEASRQVDFDALGLYRGPAGDNAFTRILPGSVSCLTWSPNGIYVCTSQAERAYALGFTQALDFAFDAPQPLKPLLRLTDVKAPLDCPSCTSGGVCRFEWPVSCTVLGSCDADGGVPLDAGGVPLDADCTTGGAGAPNDDAGVDASAPPVEPKSTGCGCRVGGRRSPPAARWLFCAGLVLVVARWTARGRSRALYGPPPR